ncbi:ABC transporter substrate-binding protein [Paenibacillus andongensis]|uniref:ABC transporter substrate-binding protein n=1 Tax=Paenibacillus andongensis TaxID=2975482 RepID=UPI0021BAF732|nr:ABC transporter substrate-binding protein [Paenibacillus andongensis]
MNCIREKFICIILFLTLGLTACGSQDEKESAFVGDMNPAPVTISITYAMGDNAHQKGIQTVINDFKKSHLNVQIKVLDNRNQAKGYADSLAMLDAMDEFPDLIEMRDTQIFADAGLLAELPEDIMYLFDKIPQVNGKVYTAPLNTEMPQGIIYNKKLFQQLGLGEPSTYQEFLEICETIKSFGVSPLVVGGKDLWHMGFWINHFMMDYVYAKDTEWNRKRSVGQTNWTDTSPLTAIQELQGLWKNGYVEPSYMNISDNQTIGYLVSGKAAMLMSGPWMFKQLEQANPDFEIGFFPVPDRNGDFHIIGLPQPSGWSISSNAAMDPEKVKYIKQFLRFFYSEEEYPKYLEAASAFPSTKESVTYRTSELMKKVGDLLRNPRMIKLRSMDQYWGADQIPPGFRNEFYSIVQNSLSGKISVDEAMIQANQAWEKKKRQN